MDIFSLLNYIINNFQFLILTVSLLEKGIDLNFEVYSYRELSVLGFLFFYFSVCKYLFPLKGTKIYLITFSQHLLRYARPVGLNRPTNVSQPEAWLTLFQWMRGPGYLRTMMSKDEEESERGLVYVTARCPDSLQPCSP